MGLGGLETPRCSRTPMAGVPGNGAVSNDVSHPAMRGLPGDFCIFHLLPPQKSQTQQPYLCLKNDESSRKTWLKKPLPNHLCGGPVLFPLRLRKVRDAKSFWISNSEVGIFFRSESKVSLLSWLPGFGPGLPPGFGCQKNWRMFIIENPRGPHRPIPH